LTKLKISKGALQATLLLWEKYLSQLEAGMSIILKRCPICSEVLAEAKKQDKYAILTHKNCKRYCPFHGRVCCNNTAMHKRRPFFWKFISFLYTDTSKAIKYAKLIIKAIQEQLEVSS